MLVAALSTEAFVNVYVKCQDVVTAKPRYVSRGAVVGKDRQDLSPQFYGNRTRRRQWQDACNIAATEAVLPGKNLPWRPWLVSTFDSEKKSKRLSGIQQHFKGRGAVNSVVLLLPGLWTARCTGVQSSVGAHLNTCFCYKVYKRAS